MHDLSNIQPVFHNSFSGYDTFKLQSGSRPWHIVLAVCEGEMLLTANGVEHMIGADEVAFFPQSLYFERRILSPITFHQLGFFMGSSTFPIPAAGKLKLPKTHVRALIESLDVAATYFPHEDTSVFRPILAQLLHEHLLYCEKETRTPIEQDRDIANTVQYMSEHIGEKIVIRELAEKLHLSYNGLLWKFKTKLGRSPDEFLIMLRMQYAEQLVLENRLRINEIATLCGYTNAYYFSNAFKKYFSCSPSEYRERSRRG